MNTIVKLVFGIVLGTAAALAYADPPGRVARLNHVLGAVSFAPAEAPDQWTQAVINRPLTGGDRLWADRDGRGEFHVGSTAVRLAQLTSLDVLHLDDDRMQLRLAQGTANVRVRALDADDVVEIATPAGAVLVRQPGSYRISMDPQSDVVRVAVNFGQAELVTPVRTFVVPSGQTAVIGADGNTAFELSAHSTPEDFDRWSAERDRREDRLESTRYVSSDMTGYEDLDQHGTWRTLPEYGAVWVPARVAPGWAPYRTGHWSWIAPWGWTWIDDAPWGFAPFHYGRWVRVHDYWGWAPGAIVRRPVYAPALVGFVGGSGFSVSVHSGPSVGWFPLGWREPYRPWYRASDRHVRNVNVTHVTNVTNITNVTHVHRNRPDAVTVVPRQTFVSARSVGPARVNVRQSDLARADDSQAAPPAQPVRASIAPERQGRRPPAQALTREVVSVTPPAGRSAREIPESRERAAGFSRAQDEPRVRVIERDPGESRRPREAREERREAREDRRPAAATAPAPAAPAAAAPAVSAPAAVARPVTAPPVSAPTSPATIAKSAPERARAQPQPEPEAGRPDRAARLQGLQRRGDGEPDSARGQRERTRPREQRSDAQPAPAQAQAQAQAPAARPAPREAPVRAAPAAVAARPAAPAPRAQVSQQARQDGDQRAERDTRQERPRQQRDNSSRP
ncbi:MAG TPA: DUF6600 domain-containing protein [Burkholderiales bacterium]|nr:DUF6600 domain-containing protein [Burkholderiales bacterium]